MECIHEESSRIEPCPLHLIGCQFLFSQLTINVPVNDIIDAAIMGKKKEKKIYIWLGKKNSCRVLSFSGLLHLFGTKYPTMYKN